MISTRFDVGTVPDRLQQPVGEPQPDQVEHGRPAEDVIQPEDVLLRYHLVQQTVELLGAGPVGAERLLQREAGVRGELEVAQQFADLHRDVRRQREEDHQRPVPACRDHLGEVGGIEQVGLQVRRVARHRVGHPGRGLDGGEGILDPRLPLRGGQLGPVRPDQADLAFPLGGEQTGQPGQQQPVGEVPTGPEDQQRHRALGLLVRLRGARHTRSFACAPPTRSSSSGPGGAPAEPGPRNRTGSALDRTQWDWV